LAHRAVRPGGWSCAASGEEIALTQAASLTTGEQVTLRRLAYGQSNPASLSVQDLRRLRELGLIDGPVQAPTMTTSGQRCFDALARPLTQPQPTLEQTLADMLRALRRGHQRPR
jgi:hypothetical protein